MKRWLFVLVFLAGSLGLMSAALGNDPAPFLAKFPNAKVIGSGSLVIDINARVSGDLAQERARKFLDKNLSLLGVPVPVELEPVRTWRFAGVEVVVFNQRIRGVPVLGAGARVALLGSTVLRLSQRLVDPASVSTKPVISALAALDQVRADTRLPIPVSLELPQPELLIDAVSVNPRLAWVVRLKLEQLGPYNFYVFVDAQTGEVYRVWNRVYFENMVNAFLPSPGHDADQPAQTVQIERLDQPEGETHLVGSLQYVTGCPDQDEIITISYQGYTFNVPVCSEVPTAEEDENGDFLFDPYLDDNGNSPFDPPESRDDKFAEGQLYYHMDKFYKWLQDLSDMLGGYDVSEPDPFNEFSQKPFKGVVNFKMPNIYKILFGVPGEDLIAFDNAFYMPAGPLVPGYQRDEDSVVFGQGTDADFVYDGDVIYHELTHAMIDTVAGLLGDKLDEYCTLDDPGAMNEGFADFFSASFTDDPRMADYLGPRMPDSSGEAALRELENDYACPDYMWGEVHRDSMHFSSALWEIRQALRENFEADLVNAAVLEAIAQLNPQPSYDEVGTLILEAIEDVFGADARSTAEQIFARHNVIGCERVIDLDGSIDNPKDKVFLPSLSYFRYNRVPGYLQFKVHVPEDHNAIVIGFYRQLQGGGGMQQPPLRIYAVASFGEMVRFSYGTQVEHSGFKEVQFEKIESDRNGYEQYRAIIRQEREDEEWPGEGDYYIAFLNATQGGGMFGGLMSDYVEDIKAFSMYMEPEPAEDGDVDAVEEDVPTDAEELVESAEFADQIEKPEGDGIPLEAPEAEFETTEAESGGEGTETAPAKKKSSSSDEGCAGTGGAGLFAAAVLLAMLRRKKR